MSVDPIVLEGQIVRLEPLQENQAIELTRAAQDERIWRYMLYGNVNTEARMRAWIADMLNRQSRGTDLPFAVIYLKTSVAIGATRYLEMRPEHRALEIGGTWYASEFHGTLVNKESKYLLLRHAFEVFNCLRVQFKTDSRNLHSQHAIESLGAVKEGVLRNHMITPEGVVRDSVYYSIIASEWLRVKARLEARLYKQSAQE